MAQKGRNDNRCDPFCVYIEFYELVRTIPFSQINENNQDPAIIYHSVG